MTPSHPGDTVATVLHQLRPDLPPSESRVARALLDGYPVSGIGTLAELAERARVSGPTVLRLVNRLGFATFGDFQRALRTEVEARLSTAASAIVSEPRPQDDGLVRTLLRETADNISADVEALVPAEVDDVVQLLAQARSVVTVGGWLTQGLAQFAWMQLQLMRPRCVRVGPSVSFDASRLLDIGRRDVVLAFDTRPYTAPTEQFCSAAKENGARIVLFTDAWLSPIATLASHVLTSRTSSSSPFDSYASMFALLEALLVGVAAQLGEPAQQRIARGEAMLDGWTWEQPDAST